MVGDPGGLEAIAQGSHGPEVVGVGGIDGADAQRDAVKDDGHVATQGLEHGAGPPALTQKVLGDHLHPIHVQRAVEGLFVVGDPQAHTVTELWPVHVHCKQRNRPLQVGPRRQVESRASAA